MPLSPDEVRALLSTGGYVRHRGLGAGRHYRKVRGRGCYHLRIDGESAFLHWDGWDPRRHPVRHLLETPCLWRPLAAGLGLSMSALAVLGLRLRAR